MIINKLHAKHNQKSPNYYIDHINEKQHEKLLEKCTSRGFLVSVSKCKHPKPVSHIFFALFPHYQQSILEKTMNLARRCLCAFLQKVQSCSFSTKLEAQTETRVHERQKWRVRNNLQTYCLYAVMVKLILFPCSLFV